MDAASGSFFNIDLYLYNDPPNYTFGGSLRGRVTATPLLLPTSYFLLQIIQLAVFGAKIAHIWLDGQRLAGDTFD